jgi:hypothetical protein
VYDSAITNIYTSLISHSFTDAGTNTKSHSTTYTATDYWPHTITDAQTHSTAHAKADRKLSFPSSNPRTNTISHERPKYSPDSRAHVGCISAWTLFLWKNAARVGERNGCDC